MFRMIRVNLRVTFGAPRRGGCFDVMRIVTVLTITMRCGQLCAKYVHFLVARAAVDRRGPAAFVGSVTGNALRVPVGKKGRPGNLRMRLGMTRGARVPGLRGRGMLARVAGRAALHRVLALGRVKGRHVFMTGSAGRRFGPVFCMRRVTSQAVTRPMHPNRRESPLGLFVATQTIPRGGRFRRLVRPRVEREHMAAQTIRRRRRAVLCFCLRTRMTALRLLLMTGGASCKGHPTDRARTEIVTRGARHFFLKNMHFVAQNTAGNLPLFGDVDPLPPFSFTWVSFVPGARPDEQEENAKERARHHTA